ncbi:hypothetical protein [Saccharothrix violaceirubra]|uniref:Uncharacterized protein n=1 Tax=Saccharothrix violaceirubra TaxID=413306 RepID=A0A7W7T2G5_9PSEU|nr:hypothetical protein [Saccharothrix violaceirubra]MBB4965380.1 hypothetical protein [Saccharothrix violaceirubra]
MSPRTLLDRTGRLWQWNPTLSRRSGVPLGVFCHRGHRRTEQELENEAEPIIEVRDPRVLAVALEPVPARQIRLNDLVVLPGLGELSPVIGVWPCTDRYASLLYVCTDNGDWAHRPVDSLLLRADIRTPGRPAAPSIVPTSTISKSPHSPALQDEEPRDG